MLILDKEGPGPVTAGDIHVNSEVEILNPENHLATLARGGRISVELTVTTGRRFCLVDLPHRHWTPDITILPAHKGTRCRLHIVWEGSSLRASFAADAIWRGLVQDVAVREAFMLRGAVGKSSLESEIDKRRHR